MEAWDTDVIHTKRGCQFRHVEDLLSLLFTVAPDVALDPNLVSRSVLLTGLSQQTTPSDLAGILPIETHTYAAAIVRDYETGKRAGLVVLASEGECEAAIAVPAYMAGPFYRKCIKARERQKPWVLKAAARDHARRRGTTDLLRHLIPPAYIKADSCIHLRCVFLRKDPSAREPFDVSSLHEALPAKGPSCAIVACKSQSIGVVVYDDADSAEAVARSLVGSRPLGLRTYDSAMFPFCPLDIAADAAGVAAAPDDQPLDLGTLIPRFYTHPEYLERILLFTGLDTDHCDAADVARRINNGLEALIVNRGQQLVVAVFSSKEDAVLQLHETADVWMDIFGLPVTCEVVHAAQLFAAQDNEEELVAPAGGPYPGMHPKASHKVLDKIIADMKKCLPDYAPGIAELLIKLTALSRPGALRHKHFVDRAVLLIGIHPTRNWDDLLAALSAYCGLDALSTSSETHAALAIFKTWNGPFRLLQEPTERCRTMGFRKCQRVPGENHAARLADEVAAEVSRFDAELRMSQVPEFDL